MGVCHIKINCYHISYKSISIFMGVCVFVCPVFVCSVLYVRFCMSNFVCPVLYVQILYLQLLYLWFCMSSFVCPVLYIRFLYVQFCMSSFCISGFVYPILYAQFLCLVFVCPFFGSPIYIFNFVCPDLYIWFCTDISYFMQNFQKLIKIV